MTMMRDINVVFRLLIVIDSVNHFTCGVGIVSPTALLQLFRFDIQLWIFIKLEELFLNLLHHLSARTAFIVFANFNRQHLFLLEVVKQVGARQHIQRANKPFAKRQVKNIFHR